MPRSSKPHSGKTSLTDVTWGEIAKNDVEPEMRQRFDAAAKTRVSETPIARPRLYPTLDSLRTHFAGPVGKAPRDLENPHVEARVNEEQRANAVPASVLIAIVPRPAAPTILVTQRHHGISYPGHWVLPGGRADESDADPFETALREAHEEIGLDPSRAEVLGRLGDYVSHSGFRIAPIVAILEPEPQLAPRPGEVTAIAEIELSRLLDSASYFLYRFDGRSDRAHFAMDAAIPGLMLTGLTVSICINFYAQLLETHAADPDVAP